MIKNLGSGVGLDMINAVKQRDGMIETVLNYDTNEQAVHFGKTIVEHLESSGDINSGVIQYVGKSLTKSNEPADLIIMIGIICGLQDSIAQFLLSQVHAQLNKGGKLIVSSSNHHMESTDPLVSFLIQHLGTKEDPMKGWQLNFRTEDAMLQVLQGAGFEEIEIYSDTDFPGKSELPDEILFGVDTLPAQAMGFEHPGEPLALPPKEILDRGIAYNWIAVATKA